MITATVPGMMDLVERVRSSVAEELVDRLDKEIIQDCLFPNSSPRNPAPLADICRHKHKGNERSEAANKLVHATKKSARERIYSLIAASAGKGLTSKELGELLGKKPLNEFSGRLTELKSQKFGARIKENGDVRNGASVLVVSQ